ncbi:hypothetical protein V8G54_027196, partial [Vigna mungo]
MISLLVYLNKNLLPQFGHTTPQRFLEIHNHNCNNINPHCPQFPKILRIIPKSRQPLQFKTMPLPILQSDNNPESKTKEKQKSSSMNSRKKAGMNPNLRDLNWLIQFTRRDIFQRNLIL